MDDDSGDDEVEKL